MLSLDNCRILHTDWFVKANNHEANACFSRVVLSLGTYSTLKKA